MKKENWVWMPYSGHLIIGHQCRFHLNTYVGGYIVSTVGEWWPERRSREIHAEVHDPIWLAENIHRKGDDFDYAYMEKFGFEDIGFDRKYETRVFTSKKSGDACCPHTIIADKNVDFVAYNDAGDARKGHMRLCNKWSKK